MTGGALVLRAFAGVLMSALGAADLGDADIPGRVKLGNSVLGGTGIPASSHAIARSSCA